MSKARSALARSSDPDNAKPDYGRLTPADISLILKLRDADKTQTEIAQIIGYSVSTVCRCLQDFQDTRIPAQAKLRNAALRLTERVIDQADVDQSMELLDRIGVAEKRQERTGATQGVQIVIGMPGQPAAQPPVLSITSSPHAPDTAG